MHSALHCRGESILRNLSADVKSYSETYALAVSVRQIKRGCMLLEMKRAFWKSGRIAYTIA